ncbi:MAG: PSD1 domain-containing protein [Planctomycetales bacterium]|nr:PSD1 domain-containing protein [Planctomycetales bacterium]
MFIHSCQYRFVDRFSAGVANACYSIAICAVLASGVSGDEVGVDFESDVAPVLIKRCVECHQGNDPAGGLDLTSRTTMLAGGESGNPVDFANVDESYLLQRIVDGEMPPEKQGKPQRLADDEIHVVRDWLANSAPWPGDRKLDFFERTNDLRAGRDWWSLQPITSPEIPRTTKLPQPANPIDAFVQRQLEANDATPAPEADRRTLIRRLYYDLIGLPPTENEIDDFVRDESPDAWLQLTNRLLDMPQYGERWGRFWLDLARYADTSGYERDQEKPFAWKYRDWVVDAFNCDMPFHQFVIEQLAGDEIENRSERSVIATGFLRLGSWNDEPNDPADYQYERLEDLVHTTSSTFLGMTVKCARCHAHKFDAIKQQDYYRMASAFWAGPVPVGSEQDLGGPKEQTLGFKEVLGWTDLGNRPQPLHVLKSGERHQPMEEIVPASLSFVPKLERTFQPAPEDAKTSRRRLQLAEWIADPNNPLTARVWVNRIWQHHFGKAIVRTPNNFGFLADPPTHPKLLDWLASEFLQNGGRTKHLHRLILTSQTWRQSTLHPDAERLTTHDAGNRLWWHAERRRLDAETLRDSLLAASTELDLTVGGEGFRPTISPEALEGLSRKTDAWQASKPEEQNRRSIYMFLKRGLLPPMMTTFDLCDPTLSCGKRDVTIVPTQALALLNNQFVHDRSEHLANVIAEQSGDVESQVKLAWSHVLRRQPTASELRMSLNHIAAQQETFASKQDSDVQSGNPTQVLGLASLCHVLMNSNEFIYVD